jgi:raffinose/stachyose/melibiose transport system substrate-binding protein
MSMHRRTLLRWTGGLAGGVALGTPLLGSTTRVMAAQNGTSLEFWSSWNTDPRLSIAEELAASFEAENQGVTAQHRGWTTEEMTDTLPRVVDSDQGPDVAQINNGEALMGPMVRAGQLVDISGYVEEYGWAEGLPEGLLRRNMYSEDGTEFGTGQLWGVSTEAEIVGIYYNRSKLEDAGIAVPSTLEELEEAFQQLADVGETPLVFGNTDQWSAIHLFGEIHGTMTSREYLDGIIYRTGEESFEDQSIIDAAARLQDWVNSGYLQAGFEGISSDDAAALFESGAGAMLVQGSWQAGSVATNLGSEDAGFFLMPPQSEGEPVMHVGGVGIPFGITTNAEDPDLAAALINTLVSDQAFDAFIEAGMLPAGEIPRDAIQADTLSGDLYTAWNSALEGDELGHFLDWAAPGFYDVITAELQRLLGNQVMPEEFAANLQEFYAASLE